MADKSLKVSLEGNPVDQALPEKCAIHPEYPCLKAKPSNFGTFTFSVSSPKSAFTCYNVLTIPHGLGYRPIVLGLVWDDTASDEVRAAPYSLSDSGDGIYITTTDTNILVSYCVGFDPTWWYGKSFTLKYYVFNAEAE